MTIAIPSTILWLALAVAAFIAGYWLGRQSARPMASGPMPEPIAKPIAHDAPPAAPRPVSNEPVRRAPPPPASAGGRPGNGDADLPNPNVKRSAPPPPAMAGGRAPAGRETGTKPPPAATKGDDPDPEPAPARRSAKPVARAGLAGVTSWGYQLQKLDLARAAGSPFDLLVIDYSKDGSDEEALTPRELDQLKTKPDGSRRLVVAYLSIGEAESYRFYWQKRWKSDKPAWLLSENPEWRENFTVCYWDAGWQRLICGGPDAYLDRIMAAGFDGVYLDKADAYYDIGKHERKVAKSRPDLEGDMADFIVRLSRYAKSRHPAFVVIMQNAEELLEREGLRQAIDGIAKEELLFGLSGPESRNTKTEVAEARQMLDLARRDGKAVLVVEYLAARAKVAEAVAATSAAGYVLYVAPKDRELDRLNYETLLA